MKTKYKVLIGLSVAQVIGATYVKKYIGNVETWLGNAVGVFAFLLPIQICLWMMQRDPSISKRKSIAANVLFWFISFAFCAGGIVTWLEDRLP